MAATVVYISYRVKLHILSMTQSIPSNMSFSYIADDTCNEGFGAYVTRNNNDPASGHFDSRRNEVKVVQL